MPRKVSQFQPLFTRRELDMHRIETLESRAAAMDALAIEDAASPSFAMGCTIAAADYRARANALRATLNNKES
jgi:hypothetical protein